MTPRRTTAGLVGWAARHRGAVTFLLLFLIASPATPDDRQLMQANAGAKAWVLLIMDSSHSMNDDFSDLYRLPAYMDDFVYVENSANVGPVSYGSKIAIAKSVIRDVIAKSETGSGINWAFSYYRNPGQVLGAADTSRSTGHPSAAPKRPAMLCKTAVLSGCTSPHDDMSSASLQPATSIRTFSRAVSSSSATRCRGPTSASDSAGSADTRTSPPWARARRVPPAGPARPLPGEYRGAFGPTAHCNPGRWSSTAARTSPA